MTRWTGDREPTRRFSDRVDDYVRYRPGYPAGVLDWLRDWGGLAPGARIADVGAGTGISSRLLLERGWRVVAVEPNAEMRAAAEAAVGDSTAYASVAGRAEATGLADRDVDAVVAAQAFHWFDPQATAAEWRRILRPGGAVALIWNRRRIAADAFQREYERLLCRHCPEYQHVGVEHTAERNLAAFFGPQGRVRAEYPQAQRLEWEALRGRACSSSYVPQADAPRAAYLAELREAFERYAEGGAVTLLYETVCFGAHWY